MSVPQIDQTISSIPTIMPRADVVTIADQDQFTSEFEATMDILSETTVDELNAYGDQVDVVADYINTKANEASTSATTAETSATEAASSASTAFAAQNNQGAWVNLLGAKTIGTVCTHTGGTWISNVAFTQIENSEPNITNTDWSQIAGASVNPEIRGSITEESTTVVSYTLAPENGTIHILTMTEDATFIDVLEDNQFVTLYLTTAGFVPTFPAGIRWWNGEPTTFGTVSKLFFEKIDGVLYGSKVGDWTA
ncbi:long tail fiber protein distal subunit [Thiohalocapsa phage LS06-2018-MD03]|nr:long tail fiber protein distal subunit [Thiohalocapsa phage LS06-2018-MD03]